MYSTEEVAKMCNNTPGTFRNYHVPRLLKRGIVPKKQCGAYWWTEDQVKQIKELKAKNHGH